MDKIGLHAFDERSQSLGGAADRQGAEPLPDGGTQPHGPRRGGAGALSLFFEATEGHWDNFKFFERKVH
jgi:hypothetical protein